MIDNISGIEANFNLQNLNEKLKENKKSTPEEKPAKDNVVPLDTNQKTTSTEAAKITNSQEASALLASIKQDILSNIEDSATLHAATPKDNSLDMLI